MLSMRSTLLFVDFSLWYYTRAFRDLLAVGLNFLWFITHYFSIPLLLKTLFSPWKRMTDTYHRTGLEDMLTTLVMNIMTRIFGAIIRLCFILFGLAVLLLSIICLFLVLALWVCMPVVLVAVILQGVILLFL